MEFLKKFFAKQPQESFVVRQVVRLSSDEYKKLEQALSKTAIDHQTTQIEAGFKLGVEHALRKIREGFVIGE